MRVILAALLLAASPRQETKLEDVLDLMEKRAEGLKDLSFKVSSRADRNMGMPRSEVSVAYVRGVGLRVRARTESPQEAARIVGRKWPCFDSVLLSARRGLDNRQCDTQNQWLSSPKRTDWSTSI